MILAVLPTMVISHKYRFVFIEIPLTASWAIRHELCEFYGGEPILHKHASYPEFRRHATVAELKYLAFATVRNPLDETVSRYFKYKTNHKGTFSEPQAITSRESEFADTIRYRFITASQASFQEYFKRFHKKTFSGMIDLSSADLASVIRFERLQEDFSRIARRLGIDQVRSIPTTNKTAGRRADWKLYYTPDIVEQAKRVFGPFMERWAYSFPAEWGEERIGRFRRVEFQSIVWARKQYYKHIRYKEGLPAETARWLRAQLNV